MQAALHALLVAERDSKPSSLADDEALAGMAEEMRQLGPRKMLALHFRIEKKQVLAAAIVATQPFQEIGEANVAVNNTAQHTGQKEAIKKVCPLPTTCPLYCQFSADCAAAGHAPGSGHCCTSSSIACRAEAGARYRACT